jgi:hypothetical protein
MSHRPLTQTSSLKIAAAYCAPLSSLLNIPKICSPIYDQL